MMFGNILSVLLVLITGYGAEAAPLPSKIQSEISKQKDDCKPEKVSLNDGFLVKKDVNGDGIEDFILDYGSFQCGDNSTIFCGSAGCLTQVFVSLDGNYVKVLDENVQGVDFKRVRGRPAMLLGFHGTACGRRGSEPCGATLFWNGSKFSAAN